MSKALGIDINNFYNNHFPQNCCIDDDAEWIENFWSESEGLCLIPTEKYELNDFGWIVDDVKGTETRFSTVFKNWLKTQNTVIVAIEISKDQQEAVRQQLKELGFKLI